VFDPMEGNIGESMGKESLQNAAGCVCVGGTMYTLHSRQRYYANLVKSNPQDRARVVVLIDRKNNSGLRLVPTHHVVCICVLSLDTFLSSHRGRTNKIHTNDGSE